MAFIDCNRKVFHTDTMRHVALEAVNSKEVFQKLRTKGVEIIDVSSKRKIWVALTPNPLINLSQLSTLMMYRKHAIRKQNLSNSAKILSNDPTR